MLDVAGRIKARVQLTSHRLRMPSAEIHCAMLDKLYGAEQPDESGGT